MYTVSHSIMFLQVKIVRAVYEIGQKRVHAPENPVHGSYTVGKIQQSADRARTRTNENSLNKIWAKLTINKQ